MSTEEMRTFGSLEEMREHFAVALLGKSRTSPCVGCESPNLNFRDELSRREYGISRFCQTCQDSVFSNDPNELDQE